MGKEFTPDNVSKPIVPKRPREVGSPEVVPGIGERGIKVGGRITPEIVDFPPDGPPMKVVDGVIQLDRKALEKEHREVQDWLAQGIENRDKKAKAVYLRNLTGTEEEVVKAREEIENIYTGANPQTAIDSLNVSLDTPGIAERNLIRNGLLSELPRQPFKFRDQHGNELSGDDLDIVFARDSARDKDRKPGFKLIIGSRKGIASIAVPQKLSPEQFAPDLTGLDKDANRNTRIFPLKKAADGTTPSSGVVEVHIGAVDVLADLARDEEEAKERKRSQKGKNAQIAPPLSTPSYSPPSYPATARPNRSGESYGYTSVSG